MGNIRILDPFVRNRIAAGEVVENPASVVKELVENSLDAAARRVQVEISEGGTKSIKVTDDGAGILPDDVALTVDHFATSKIAAAEDIFGVATYGFRGEALAAISAVSRFTLTTRRRELDEGTTLRILENGRKRVFPTGAPPGTTVLVEDLFFSFPARRKFLKSAQAETARVAEVVLRIALFRPDVSFLLRSDKRILLDLPERKEWLERIADCIGPEAAADMAPLEAVEGGIVQVNGFFGRPSLHRNNRTGIFTAVADRPIYSTELLNAVIIGYRGLLPEKRYPVAVFSIKVPPRHVDVNVHPQKKEARFRDMETITRVLRREIARVLVSAEAQAERVVEEAVTARAGAVPEQVEMLPDMEHPGSASVVEKTGPATKPAGSPVSTAAATAPSKERFDLWHGAMKMHPPLESAPRSPARGQTSTASEPALPAGTAVSSRTAVSPGGGSGKTDQHELPQNFLYIGQTTDGYMVVEASGKLRIVDPHALHERMIYERLCRREGAGETLKMLFPAVVSLAARERVYKELVLGVLRGIGFDADDFGPGEIAVSAVPPAFEGGDPAAVVRDLIDALAAGAVDNKDAARNLRHKALASAACHAAVKLGKRFTEDEAVAFLRDAASLSSVQVCPHGRPTSVDIDMGSIRGRLSR